MPSRAMSDNGRGAKAGAARRQTSLALFGFPKGSAKRAQEAEAERESSVETPARVKARAKKPAERHVASPAMMGLSDGKGNSGMHAPEADELTPAPEVDELMPAAGAEAGELMPAAGAVADRGMPAVAGGEADRGTPAAPPAEVVDRQVEVFPDGKLLLPPALKPSCKNCRHYVDPSGKGVRLVCKQPAAFVCPCCSSKNATLYKLFGHWPIDEFKMLSP